MAQDDDEGAEPQRGLVAIIDLREENCEAIFEQSLDSCADCADAGDYVILAHIENYSQGLPVVNELEQQINNTANLIDNLTLRHIVPSAAQLREVIHCLVEQGISSGIPGPRGQSGVDGTHGEDGAPGASGWVNDPEVGHIAAVNWMHDGNFAIDGWEYDTKMMNQGLVIAFSKDILHQNLSTKGFAPFIEVQFEYINPMNAQEAVKMSPARIEWQPVVVNIPDIGDTE
ncbi:MAG: collagen-like protein, partial [Psychrosphaera sp.]|nr:collagen-like protein [Psychrosphaera sp.]